MDECGEKGFNVFAMQDKTRQDRTGQDRMSACLPESKYICTV